MDADSVRGWIFDQDETPQHLPLQKLLRRLVGLVPDVHDGFCEVFVADGYLSSQWTRGAAELPLGEGYVVPTNVLDAVSAGTEEWFYWLVARLRGTDIWFGVFDSGSVYVEGERRLVEGVLEVFERTAIHPPGDEDVVALVRAELSAGREGQPPGAWTHDGHTDYLGLFYEDPVRHVRDPRRLPVVDSARVRTVVARLVLAAAHHKADAFGPLPPWTRATLERALQQALVAELGAWAEGMFATTQRRRSWGNPGGTYCCAAHSLFVGPAPRVAGTIDLVLAGLEEWRALLQAFGERLAVARRASSPQGLADNAVKLAREPDGWPTRYERLRLLVSSCGLAFDADGRLDEIASDDRRWEDPAQEQTVAEELRDTFARLVPAVAPAAERTPHERWDRTRGGTFWAPIRDDLLPIAWDGHREWILGSERAQDVDRANRLLLALDACRGAATLDEDLDVERLGRWLAVALGDERPVTLREGAPRDLGTTWLAQANDPRTPLAIRAARAFLDVSFLRPFAHGNRAAARLALDFVLWREGFVLRVAGAFFDQVRDPDDRDGAGQLAACVGWAMGKRALIPAGWKAS